MCRWHGAAATTRAVTIRRAGRADEQGAAQESSAFAKEIAEELGIAVRTARDRMLEMAGHFYAGKHLRVRRLDFENWIKKQQEEASCPRSLSAAASGMSGIGTRTGSGGSRARSA